LSPAYHPRAYVAGMRNVNRGLASRTRIIESLEKGRNRVSDISEKTGLSNSCVSYHLLLMRKNRTVSSSQAGRENRWTLTKYGQEKLFA
jgi:predicted transcriptional regulator